MNLELNTKNKKELVFFFSENPYTSLLITKENLPGTSSGFRSLCFPANEYAGDEPWTFFSAFSTSYDPGAIQKNFMKVKICKITL